MDPSYRGSHNVAIFTDRERTGIPNQKYFSGYCLGNPCLGRTQLPNKKVKGRELRACKLYEGINEKALMLIGQAVARKNNGEDVDLTHLLD